MRSGSRAGGAVRGEREIIPEGGLPAVGAVGATTMGWVGRLGGDMGQGWTSVTDVEAEATGSGIGDATWAEGAASGAGAISGRVRVITVTGARLGSGCWPAP